MTDAKIDGNFKPTLIAVSSSDGKAIVPLYADPITHRLLVDIPAGVGNVTSVSALTLGTTGNDLSSTVATGTTTPVITLQVPTASATARGALSSTDWSTFNGKQNTLTNPITGTGTTNELSYWASASTQGTLPVATYPSLTEVSYVKGVTSAIQTQINAKGVGTVTAVSVATANGVSGSSSGGATPAITLSLGAITPTSVNSVTISGSATPTLGVTGTTTVSGANTGDNAANSSSTFIGTTSVALNRTSAALTLAGITLTTPVLGVATATSINKVAFTAPATASTLTIADGQTLTVNGSATITNGTHSGTNSGDNATNSTYTTLATTIATANSWTATQTFQKIVNTVTAMGAQALDGSTANVFTRTLGASETFTQSNFTTGQCFMVEVKQGSGTSYTVTWFAGVTWITSGATAPVQTTTTNGITTYGFRCTGSNTFLGYLIATQ